MPPAKSTNKKERKPRVVKEPTKRQLDYIVTKFVQRDKIIWPRDVGAAKNLFSQYPKFLFWTSLPVHFQMISLTPFVNAKGSRDFLKVEWAKFNLPEVVHEPIILEPTVQCDPRAFERPKPRSILDFCKSNA